MFEYKADVSSLPNWNNKHFMNELLDHAINAFKHLLRIFIFAESIDVAFDYVAKEYR